MTAADKVDKHHEEMCKKYGTVHWDRVCTETEWAIYTRLCELKHAEEKEEDED